MPSDFRLFTSSSIKDSKNIDKYNEYLNTFPNGIFSGLAKLEIQNLSKNNNIIDKKHEEGKSELIVTIKNKTMLPAEVYLRKKTKLNYSLGGKWIKKGKTPLKTNIDPGLYDIKIVGYQSSYECTYSKEIYIESEKKVSIEARMRIDISGTPSSAQITVSDL